MLPAIAYQIIAFLCITFFLPLPIFWFILHRNIRHFRKYQRHALYMKAGMLVVAAVFALYNINDISSATETDIVLKVVGVVLFALTCYLTYKTAKLLGKDTLVGVSEIRNREILVSSGIYRAIRHPKYLTVFTFLLGVFLITGITSLAYLFIYSLITFYLVSIEEEKELEKRLGSKYSDYKKTTGRFLPKLGRKVKKGNTTSKKKAHAKKKRKP